MGFLGRSQLTKKVVSEDIYTFLIALVACTLSFPKYAFNSISIILLLSFWVFSGRLITKLKSAFSQKEVWIFCALYLIYILGLIHTEDFKRAFSLLERMLPILIVPIVLSSIEKIERKRVTWIHVSFITSVIAASLFCLINAFLQWKGSSDPIAALISNPKYLYSNLLAPLDITPTYFAMFILLALSILFFYFDKVKEKKTKVLTVVTFLYLNLYLFLLANRTGIIVLAILGIFIFFKSNRKIKALLVLTLVILGALMFKSDFWKQRIFNTTGMIANSQEVKDLNKHRAIATEIFLNQDPKNYIFGYGTGDTQMFLNLEYRKRGRQYFKWSKNMNFHNQYFQIIAVLGIFGLVVLLSNLIYPFWSNRKDPGELSILYLMFMAIVIIFFMTESVLVRQKGIVFYAIFNSLYAFHNYNIKIEKQ